jgi:outer membrane biosynthesis protein TonB
VVKPPPAPPKTEPKPPKAETEAAPKPRAKAAEPVPSEKKPKKTKVEETDDAEEVTVGKKKIVLDLKREKVSEKDSSDARAQARSTARSAQAQLSERVSQIVGAINRNASTGTPIEIPGPGGEAYADYGQVVELFYRQAWTPPPDLADDAATVEATVVILRSGTVDSFRITKHSGQGALDKSVGRLESIRFIRPFPDGARDDKRKFIIEFNLRSLKSL